MWYVEYLLLNREDIREVHVESTEYYDLLSVETTLKNLTNSGVISNVELSVLASKINIDFLNNKRSIKRYEGHPDTATKIFSGMCDKISIVLGDIFTDVGYAHYMQEKYDLTDEQVQKLERYMLSNFRHKILVKPYTEKES